MTIKGLDDHLTGNNHFQTKGEDFSHTFNPVINLCEWITEEMWDDYKTLSKMENALWEILEQMVSKDANIMSKRTQAQFIEQNAKAIADEFKQKMGL